MELDLELDVEPVEPFAHKHRLGPSTVEGAFEWPRDFWSTFFKTNIDSGLNLGDTLKETLKAGLSLDTEYSGMGGPEEALRMILRAGAVLSCLHLCDFSCVISSAKSRFSNHQRMFR